MTNLIYAKFYVHEIIFKHVKNFLNVFNRAIKIQRPSNPPLTATLAYKYRYQYNSKLPWFRGK